MIRLTLLRSSSLLHSRKMTTLSETKTLDRIKKHLIPDFSQISHKGLAGRIGVVGGSVEYTGAPYFSAMSALRTGCDLTHVFCLPEAAPVIKSYSPDLIVHPLLGDSEEKKIVENIGPWLPRLHCLIIGPGLGRDPAVLQGVAHIVHLCRVAEKPLVVDADGLWLAMQQPDVFQDYPAPIVMTPNAPEYDRLVKALLKQGDTRTLAEALGPNAVVLKKGPTDLIQGAGGEIVECTTIGSWRRCGGQGDLLSGSVGTFLSWEIYKEYTKHQTGILASYAGCHLIRQCNKRAFGEHGRSMCASDMLAHLHSAFYNAYGA